MVSRECRGECRGGVVFQDLLFPGVKAISATRSEKRDGGRVRYWGGARCLVANQWPCAGTSRRRACQPLVKMKVLRDGDEKGALQLLGAD